MCPIHNITLPSHPVCCALPQAPSDAPTYVFSPKPNVPEYDVQAGVPKRSLMLLLGLVRELNLSLR